MAKHVLPRLAAANVDRVTLTGGEPFAHSHIVEIAELASSQGMEVGICTNGASVPTTQLDALQQLGNVHVNVSLDGFGAESHDRFRGVRGSFDATARTVRELAQRGLLQGILSTPHEHASLDAYRELANFSREVGARYLLLNPLARMGRGARSADTLRADARRMLDIVRLTREVVGDTVEVVPIRIPERDQDLPLAPCIAGDVIYVFADGDVALCPYLVFAARTLQSNYADTEFIVGNILRGGISSALDVAPLREQYPVTDPTCGSCSLSASCGRGCPAAVISEGGYLHERDREVCPF
jgi:radical SAM protein with 4Fe4S-binding SPASM domain